MAGTTVTIVFATRQNDIPACRIVNLKFTEGDMRAEYISGTEEGDDDGWHYTFLVQEEDLPSGLVLAEVQTCNVIAPFWTCVADDEEAEEEDECRTRVVTCFAGVPLVDEIAEDDEIAILRLDPECETYCLKRVTQQVFRETVLGIEDPAATPTPTAS